MLKEPDYSNQKTLTKSTNRNTAANAIEAIIRTIKIFYGPLNRSNVGLYCWSSQAYCSQYVDEIAKRYIVHFLNQARFTSLHRNLCRSEKKEARKDKRPLTQRPSTLY